MARIYFCPRCGGPTERRLIEGRERDACPGCERTLYENAKPCAGCIVVENGAVLLTKRAIPPFLDFWDIPGGFLEADEHPQAGAVREVLEETGLIVAVTGLVGMYVDAYEPGDDPTQHHHTLNIFFEARPVGGKLTLDKESSDLRWFSRSALPPWEEIAYENGRRALKDWLAKG